MRAPCLQSSESSHFAAEFLRILEPSVIAYLVYGLDELNRISCGSTGAFGVRLFLWDNK